MEVSIAVLLGGVGFMKECFRLLHIAAHLATANVITSTKLSTVDMATIERRRQEKTTNISGTDQVREALSIQQVNDYNEQKLG